MMFSLLIPLVNRPAMPLYQIEQQEGVVLRPGNAQLAGHDRAVRHRASDAQGHAYRIGVRVIHHHGIAHARLLGQHREHALSASFRCRVG